MSSLRDILRRFRPAGAPGAAVAAGVPVDRHAGIEAELEPVFAALTDVGHECVELRRAGAALARGRTLDAAKHREAILARAREDVPAERAAAAAGSRRDVEAEIADIEATAVRDADDVRGRSDAMMPGLIVGAVARVRQDIAALRPSHGPVLRP